MPAANFQNVADDVVLPLQRLNVGDNDGGDVDENAALDEAKEGAQQWNKTFVLWLNNVS